MKPKKIDIEKAHELHSQIRSNEAFADSAKSVGDAVITLARQWRSTKRDVYMNGVDGAPDWKEFEHRIWSIGEDLRTLLRGKPAWRGNAELFDSFASIAASPEYDKGRQTFVLLLGEFRGNRYHDLLGDLLSDENMDGFAIKSLTKAKNGKFAVQVQRIAERSTGWKKKAARTYLRKWGPCEK